MKEEQLDTPSRRRTETSRQPWPFLTVPFLPLLFRSPLTLTLALVADLSLVSPPDRRMGMASQDAIKQLAALMDQLDEPLKITFQNVHQGYTNETLVRFLKAREGNVNKAHKMLVDCLNWRIQNEIDNILFKPITPTELYRAVRDSQLIGLSGYSKEGQPVFAIGVGLSTLDKASVHYYVQSHIQINEYRDRVVLPAATKKYGGHIGTCLKVLDMTGLKLSALSQIKLLTIISTIDDLNYPEKTETYYIVNAPCIFSACWKVVKPLLQERTRRKVRVLHGCGRDELLKVMDYASLPHFCRREGSGSSRYSSAEADDCFSLDHPFHQQLYNYIKQRALNQEFIVPIKQGSFHVDVPEPDSEGTKIVKTLESELHKFGDRNGLAHSMKDLKIDGA
ncbi:phosphatidylinositol/phosphatidylcholine transfer protein SFH2 [Elaeis guineensis]|uniref:SEC14 cytosolic factor n=1 Tax=Elaeis guineensis var. tenera TaxID=51953 RepID=A0A6I9RN04_ELAGV|nr:SEC14 cytosolic factor [Elaeis guineensis]